MITYTECTRAPLKTALASWAPCINIIIIIIMDDFIVYGKSAEEHDENLQNTFQVIEESGLKLNKEKCEIKKNLLTCFGHVLSAEGVSPD